MHTMEGSIPRLMQAANTAPLLDSLETAAPARQPAPTSLYQLTCARLDEQLAPLKVWPTLPDRTGRFSFTLLDRCVIANARLAAVQAGQGFPSWGVVDVACPMYQLPATQLPCAGCRLLKCKS